mgnify:FL=1
MEKSIAFVTAMMGNLKIACVIEKDMMELLKAAEDELTPDEVADIVNSLRGMNDSVKKMTLAVDSIKSREQTDAIVKFFDFD